MCLVSQALSDACLLDLRVAMTAEVAYQEDFLSTTAPPTPETKHGGPHPAAIAAIVVVCVVIVIVCITFLIIYILKK